VTTFCISFLQFSLVGVDSRPTSTTSNQYLLELQHRVRAAFHRPDLGDVGGEFVEVRLLGRREAQCFEDGCEGFRVLVEEPVGGLVCCGDHERKTGALMACVPGICGTFTRAGQRATNWVRMA
jgi:hypothetical protein